uniref:Uncharacterized protein n=1 Tax=Vespula pensylvanica TaxID=30213 RepID=A0A834P050_VESPE|nr:hypothetical protein H0235_008537 [Vespula pensylvanica]
MKYRLVHPSPLELTDRLDFNVNLFFDYTQSSVDITTKIKVEEIYMPRSYAWLRGNDVKAYSDVTERELSKASSPTTAAVFAILRYS